MTFDEYRRIQAVNASLLKAAYQSPKHAKHAQDHDEDSDTLRRGRAAHTAILEPSKYADEYIVYDGRRDNRMAVWRDFQAEHADRCILTPAQDEEARGMAAAVRAHPDAAALLARGRAEMTITWTETVDGFAVACKARLDWIHPDGFLDLKTARDVSPRGFARQAAQLLYHVQLAHYRKALASLGHPDAPVAVLTVEPEPPHDVVTYDVPDVALDAGEALRLRLLATVAECQRAGRWPGISDKRLTLELPQWAPGMGDVWEERAADAVG